MDVVDIDKILDDFELDEDRNARGSNQFGTQQVSSGRDNTNHVWGASQSSATESGQNRERVSQLKTYGEASQSKVVKSNFVNVSNVFMSLNEYVNAEIDTKAVTKPFESFESTACISDHLPNVAVPLQSDGVDISGTFADSEMSLSTHVDRNDQIVPDQGNCRIEDQISSGDEQSTSPISDDTTTISNTSSDVVNQCSEEAVLLANVNGGNVANSDDEEESSSAIGVRTHDETLSQGENTTASLTHQESLTSYSSEDAEVSATFDRTDDTNKKNEKDQLVPISSVDESTSIGVNTTVDETKTPSTSLPLPASLLSSNNELSIMQISSMITTLPAISTNDSITEETNDICDVSKSETALSHEELEPNCVSTQDNGSIPCENRPHVQIDKIDDSRGAQNNMAPEPISDVRFIKPLCFEAAATMDDVSDTELESYLQELEDMEASPAHVDESAKNFSQLKAEVSNPEHTGEPVGLRDDNDKNADSFSLASTVEFADVGCEGDFNASSVQSNKNVNVKHWQTQISSNETDQFSSEESNNIVQSDYAQHSDSIESAQAQFMQRPNTLELPPSYNEAMSSTAGATPAVLSPPNENGIENTATTGNFDESNISEISQQSIQSPSAPSLLEQQIQDPLAAIIADRRNTVPGCNLSISELGKVQPYWIPDSETTFCMQCNMKFSFIKRRHHCRACGQVLCSTCCSLKSKLEYMGDVEARICIQCDMLLNSVSNMHINSDDNEHGDTATGIDVASALDSNQDSGGLMSPSISRSPNPNNPMEYCSTIPPLQQVGSSGTVPPMVMVPGVLKREGASSKPARKDKNVMFSDGIRPGCDLTDLDNNWGESSGSDGSGNNYRKTGSRRVQTPPGSVPGAEQAGKKQQKKSNANKIKYPPMDEKTNSFIPRSSASLPKDAIDIILPPICNAVSKVEYKYTEVTNNIELIERLKNEQLKFIIQPNFFVLVKIIKLFCCINKTVINFTTKGMHHVGQDEIVILLELDESNTIPKDIFIHLNEIYRDADKGHTISELGLSIANSSTFLGSKEHGGFLYIRTTFQCLQNVHVPENPYLIGILIHRWEIPWAKIFPLRLMLRLGALYRYYPSPHVSVRGRNSVYAEIAQTIINFLADFRTYSYTLATIRGMFIHMEDRRTNVLLPRNRYDQVMKALNNSSEHILALAGNFSKLADGHLVCVQNIESGCAETHAYSTQAINIQGKPRKVTGASFLVLNGALKAASGLSGKCSIVEDGLMVQILPKKMAAIQQALKTMKDIDIVCGPVDAELSQTEVVSILWVENDTEFNVGVISCIDKKPMDGIPSIRVHRGLELFNSNHIIRWTEVFIIKSDEESAHGKDPIDMSKLSEQIAKSACTALVAFLDLLAANGLLKLALRATLDPDQVCYEAGSNYEKLAPLYMNALDNELVPTLHRQASNLQLEQPIIIELIFHILDE